jgi:hypothetical protein
MNDDLQADMERMHDATDRVLANLDAVAKLYHLSIREVLGVLTMVEMRICQGHAIGRADFDGLNKIRTAFADKVLK